MLIVDDGVVIDDVEKVKRRKIAHHDVICLKYKCSYIWYLLIALSVFINGINLLYFRDKLGFHSYLIIGLLILYFRHLITDFILEDEMYYDVIDEDDTCIHVEYSKVNESEYLNEVIKPRFDMFTVIKVFLRYSMYVFFAYYLHESMVGVRIGPVYIDEINNFWISLILTFAMFLSSYLSIDFDYCDYHYYLNFSLTCLISFLFFQFTLFQNMMTLFIIVSTLGILFYCLYHSKNKILLKIFIILFCLFSHYHHVTYHYSNFHHTYYNENGAYF